MPELRYLYGQPYGAEDAAGGFPEELKDGLIGFWSFNGNALDAHGSLDLTAVNSPTYGTGLVYGEAADLEETSDQYFTHANATGLNINERSWMVAGWVRPETVTGPNTIYGKRTGAANGIGLEIWTAGELRFRITDSASFTQTATGATLSVDTWYFVRGLFDRSGGGNGIPRVGVNDGAWSSASNTSFAVQTTTAAARWGAEDILGNREFDGLYGPLMIWQSSGTALVHAMTDDGIATLYNGGAGLPYV